jgi:hypothetical protein
MKPYDEDIKNWWMGANGITQTKPICFLIAFGEIFWEYSWNNIF